MISKLAALLKRHNAQRITPDMKLVKEGVGDLRFALGIGHLPEDQPAVCFVFQNDDAGPYHRHLDGSSALDDASDGPANSLNDISTAGTANDAELFDAAHYDEMARANTRPTLPPTMAMACCIKGPGAFEKLALAAGRAFLKDAEGTSDLSLTLMYVPGISSRATLPLEQPYQVTFTPSANPVRIMPQASEQERRAEPELFGEMGQKAWDAVQTALKAARGTFKPG